MQTPVILIVEDEEVTRLNLVSLFQGEGYDVIEAVNGEEMNQKLTENKVNLVVMDINLPGKNGLILARELRQKENIGLIFLTGRDSEVDRILGLEIGADDYLTKPFAVVELVARAHVAAEAQLGPRRRVGGVHGRGIGCGQQAGKRGGGAAQRVPVGCDPHHDAQATQCGRQQP